MGRCQMNIEQFHEMSCFLTASLTYWSICLNDQNVESCLIYHYDNTTQLIYSAFTIRKWFFTWGCGRCKAEFCDRLPNLGRVRLTMPLAIFFSIWGLDLLTNIWLDKIIQILLIRDNGRDLDNWILVLYGFQNTRGS